MSIPEDLPIVTKITATPFFLNSLSVEDRQKLVGAASILKKAYLANPKPTAYQEFLRVEGVDITQQSAINIQNLLSQLDDISWLPVDEQQWYINKNGEQSRFSEDESLLIAVWRTQLVPLFTLKHASHYVDDFDILTSLGEREKSGKVIINGHTNRHAIRYNSFAVLGFGENHETPNFLDDEAEEIIVYINKMEEDIINLRGLWISTHLSDFYVSRNYNPIEFGGTKRQEFYEKSGLKKTISYIRQDGTQFSRRLTYRDEIFAANPSIKVIFNILLYQFILELRYLGKAFREYVKENLDDSHKLISIFHTLFPSWVYPEVKLPRPLAIKDKPYITIRPKGAEETNSELAALCEAIRKGNYQSIQRLIQNESLVNMKNSQGATPLEEAIKKEDTQAIHMLLAAGANPYRLDSLIISVFETGNVHVIDIFCRGIANSAVNSINYFFDLNNRREEILRTICKLSNVKALLEKIKEYHLNTDNLPVLVWLYPYKKDKLVTELLPFYDLNAQANGKTILMLAAENGDNDLIEALVNLNVNVNFSITYPNYSAGKRRRENWTALHYAVRGGHYTTVALLIEKGANLNSENSKGQTPLGLSQALQKKDKAQYAKKANKHAFSGRLNHRYAKIFDELLKKWHDISQLLIEKGGVQPLRVPSLLQQSTERQFSCVALITMKINGEPYIVLVRKGDYAGNPIGHYLAPGGLIDEADKDSRSATCREILEETTLILNPDDLKHIYEFEYLNGAQYCHTTFFHIELPETNQVPRLVPKSDVAEAVFIKWSELTFKAAHGPRFKNFPIKPSNILLFRSIIEAKEIPCDEVTNQIIYEGYEGLETLLTAIKNKDINEVETLCSKGIDPSQSTILHVVCGLKESEETLSIIRSLLRYGADINKLKGILAAKFGLGIAETPLSTAIRCGNENVTDLLLANHADVNLGFMNIFPLTIACFTRNFFLIEKLLKNGAILEQNVGGCILLACIYAGNEELAIKLLKTGKINLNKKYEISGIPKCYPLELAARRVATPFIDLLISYGARIDILSHEKLSLLKLLDNVEEVSLANQNMLAMILAQKSVDGNENQELDHCGLLCLTNIFPDEAIQLARLCIYKEMVRLALIKKTGDCKNWFLNDAQEKDFISSLRNDVINNLPLIFYVFGYHLYLKAKAENFTNLDFSAKASNYLRKAGAFTDAERFLNEVNLKTDENMVAQITIDNYKSVPADNKLTPSPN